MADLKTIIAFVENQTGSESALPDSDITDDLGVDGDDFFDLVKAFSEHFNVDISTCLWYFHCAEEGSFNNIGSCFFRSPEQRVKHIPVTPLMLFEFANRGKWDIDYPEHKLPKRRYDLVINQVLVGGFIIYIVLRYVVL